MSMEFKFNLISIIVIGFCKLSQQEICGNNRSAPICCTNYRKVNGACVACPRGSYGVNCSKACPKGFYGEFCTGKCSCSELEFCDVAYGCSDNSTDEMPTSLFRGDIPTSSLLTIEVTTEQNYIELKTYTQAVPLPLYFFFAGCVSLLCIMCLIGIYRNVKHTRRGITQNITDAQTLEQNSQDISPPQEVIVDVPGSDYAEIHECNPTYSSCAEVSDVYNVLSFSRSRFRSDTFNTVSALYSTSKDCSVQKTETLSLESKPAGNDIANIDPADIATNINNQTEEDGSKINQKENNAIDCVNPEII